jgi:hypothetical protein
LREHSITYSLVQSPIGVRYARTITSSNREMLGEVVEAGPVNRCISLRERYAVNLHNTL